MTNQALRLRLDSGFRFGPTRAPPRTEFGPDGKSWIIKQSRCGEMADATDSKYKSFFVSILHIFARPCSFANYPKFIFHGFARICMFFRVFQSLP